MEQLMGGEGRVGRMGLIIQAHLTITVKVEKESIPLQMEVCMKETGVKI